MKKAMNVGCLGQDGKLLSELLAGKNYQVRGIEKGGDVDIAQSSEVEEAVKAFQPDEIYYLAALHHSSQDRPIPDAELFEKSFQINTFGLIYFLEAMKKYSPRARLIYAASSRVFGEPATETQDESTPMNPVCAYGMSKAAGVSVCRYYRKEHSLFASAAILYNHESTLRDEKFVSRKIVKAAINIKNGTQQSLELGDLNAEIDWGFAPDYVDAMYRIGQLAQADDFIVATQEKHSVREFVEIAFGALDLDWKKYVKENKGIIVKQNKVCVGNSSKLRLRTGWQPSVNFKQMIHQLLQGEGVETHG